MPSDSENGGHVVSTLRRNEDERREMLSCLGSLFCLGRSVFWSKLFPACESSINFPPILGNTCQHWHESKALRTLRLGCSTILCLDGGWILRSPFGKSNSTIRRLPFLWDHVVQGHVLFPAAGYLEIGIAVAREIFGLDTLRAGGH